MLLFPCTATIPRMRYVATLLALFVVATAAAAEEWREASSVEPEPIELRPTEPPAETAATLLDLKRRPALPALPAPEVNGSRTNGVGTKVAARRPAKPAARSASRAPVTQLAQAPRRPALGARPAPAPKPVAIAAGDDRDDDEGGDDDD
jgi:hypothetical protein